MKKAFMPIVAGVMALVLCLLPMKTASADSTDETTKGYVSFGADLTDDEKLQTMGGLGISAVTIGDYTTDTVTNAEEHKYLDAYLDSSVIGTKALSSVKVEEAGLGTGINVTTTNITYCTSEMYTNALATAGFTDVTVMVSAPYEISGTAALVGAMKAYSAMKGEELDETSLDAANNELVVTGQLGESVGQSQAAELIALVKNRVISDGLTSEDDIKSVVKTAAKELDVKLTDAQIDEIVSLMTKIKDLNLDVNSIKSQAKGIYDQLKSMDINPDKARGFFGKIGLFFKKLWSSITGVFG